MAQGGVNAACRHAAVPPITEKMLLKYADDVLVLVRSRTAPECSRKLVMAANDMASFVNGYGAALNKEKTELAILPPAKVRVSGIRIKLWGKEIKSASRVKYLGTVLVLGKKYLGEPCQDT